MKKGSKNVVTINSSIETIETLTKLFKLKRMTQDEYVKRVNQALASMTTERDYIQYLQNIGQY